MVRGIAGFALAMVLAMVLAMPAAAQPSEAQSHYESAVMSLHEGEYQAAIIHLKLALQADPAHLPSRLLAGDVNMRLHAPVVAADQFKRALAAGADRAYVLPRLAEAYLAQLKFEHVLAEIEANSGHADPDSEIQVLRGRAYLELGRLEDADQAFAAAAELRPRRADAWLGQADVRLRRGQGVAAARLVEKALSADAGSASAWHLRGDMQRGLGNLEQALTSYDRSLALDAQRLDARVSRAVALLGLGRTQEALRDVELVLETTTDHAYATFLHARILARMGKGAEAEAALRAADEGLSALAPALLEKHPPSLYLLGARRLEQENYERAYRYLHQFHLLRPNHIQGRKLLARLLLVYRGEPQAAADLLDPLAEVLVDDLELFVLLGEIHFERGDVEKAVAHYARALELASDSPALHRRLADIQIESARGDEATAGLIRTFLLDPNDTGSALRLASMLHKAGDYDRAIALGRWIHERLPDNPVPLNLVGAALLEKGDVAAARTQFERAIALSSGHAAARLNLAKLARDEGRADQAEQHLNMILESDEGHPHALAGLADIAIAGGRIDDAMAVLERLRIDDPAALAGVLQLIELYTRSRDPLLAQPFLQALEQRYRDDPQVLIASAELALRLGQPERAVPVLARARRVAADSPELLVHIAVLQSAAGEHGEAYFTLTQLLRESPSLLSAHSVLVKVEMQMGKWEAALSRATAVRNSFPDKPIGDVLVGDVRMALGQFEEAVAAYLVALDKQADPAVAAKVFEAKHRASTLEASLAWLAGWAQAHPDDRLARRILATRYLALGRVEAARTEHERLVELGAQDLEILNNLAWLYLRDGDPRALELAERAYALAPHDAASLDTLGWILTQRGETARGLAVLREAHARASQRPEVLFHLAVALEAQGNVREAARHLEHALAPGQGFEGRADAEALLRSLSGE